MKRIPLSQGKHAIVDDEDFDRINQWKWYATKIPKLGTFYAVRHLPWKTGEKRRSTSMHREVMGLSTDDKRQVDHRESGATLDNRKTNLRIATSSQNSRNRRTHRNTLHGVKGVSFEWGAWRARIYVDGKRKHLGSFATKELAHQAYKDAAILYFGEFARAV